MANMQSLFCIVPVGYFILSILVSCAALNVSQQYRIYFLFPIIFSGIKAFASINYLESIAPEVAQILGHMILIHIIHITSVLYLEKWQLNTGTSGWDFHAAFKIWGNPRLLNTPREVPYAQANPSARPTRLRFLCDRCLQLGVFYLINKYIVTAIFPGAFMPLSIHSFNPTSETYLRRLFHSQVTVYESFLRAVFAVRWMWLNVFGAHLAHTAGAIVFSLILRWDEPREWPPFFGSPLEAYSLRRFWGRFWHRIIARPYSMYGLSISRVCGLKANSPAEKIFVATFVFLLAGVAHALVTWQTMGCGQWTDISWFLLNAVATVGETVVSKLWMQIVHNTQKYTGKFSKLYRLLGALWVFAFFFWSVPKWEYGKIYCVAQQMQV